MKERIIAGIGILIGLALIFWVGSPAIHILAIVIVGISGYEIYRTIKTKVPVYVLPIILGILTLGMYLKMEALFSFLAISLIILFTLSLVVESFSITTMSIVYLMILLVTMAYQSIMIIMNEYNLTVLLMILVGTYATDTFAYFGGMFFGKHKLIPKVSPKKTVEGAVSGFLFGCILMYLFGYFLIDNVIPNNLLILLAIGTPIIAQIGDLSFSLIKRQLNIKDYGNLIPGHGGVLDRIDSLVFTLMYFTVILNLFGYM